MFALKKNSSGVKMDCFKPFLSSLCVWLSLSIWHVTLWALQSLYHLLLHNTGSSRSDTCLSVVGRVRECLAWEGQQFEHFTKNVIWCAWVWYCYVTELHAYDFVIKDVAIKNRALFVPDSVYTIRYCPLGGNYITVFKNFCECCDLCVNILRAKNSKWKC